MSRPSGTYAIFETSQGNIVVKLLEKEAPKTVENFIGLAEGTKEFTDESTGKKLKKNFYDGLVFHRGRAAGTDSRQPSPTGLPSTGREMDAGHAVEGRWMGRLRRR